MQESGYRRSIFHKGLVSTCGAFVLMVAGIVLIEVFFPIEGVRGFSITISNDSNCSTNLDLCFTYRTLRSVGVFSFFSEFQTRIIAVYVERITQTLVQYIFLSCDYHVIAAGLVNWIFIELLFRRVPCIRGRLVSMYMCMNGSIFPTVNKMNNIH